MASREKLSTTEPTVDEIKDVVRKSLPGGGEVTKVTWITNFRLHHRVGNSYRDGRIFLIGDAAHIHSPVGGQGLNTALQDALNLGWKLGSVIRGDRPESFLDTFDEERRRVGQELVSKTDKIFKLVSVKNPLAISLRKLVLSWLAPYIMSKANLESFYNFVSQFSINYHESSLTYGGSTMISGPVKAGDRAPDGEVDIDGETKRFYKLLSLESHNLVLFSGPLRTASVLEDLKSAAAKFEAKNNMHRARVHIITQERGIRDTTYSHRLHKTYGFSFPGFVYIRPDGYVAAIDQLDRLEDFLKWLSQST